MVSNVVGNWYVVDECRLVLKVVGIWLSGQYVVGISGW